MCLHRLPTDVLVLCYDFLHGTSDLPQVALVCRHTQVTSRADVVWSYERAEREGVLHKALAYELVQARARVFGLRLYKRTTARRGHAMDSHSLWVAVRMWLRDRDAAKRAFGPIEYWDISKVDSLDMLFSHTNGFGDDISRWDVSNVTNMHGVFYGAVDFAGDISRWDVSSARRMSYMFYNATNFNGDVSRWNTASARTFRRMFCYTNAFNGDLSKWNTSRVRHMGEMFWGARCFTCDLSKWDVSKVKVMSGMFFDAIMFDGNISTWAVANVCSMDYMFCDASSFTSDLSSWDVSSVRSASQIFAGAHGLALEQRKAFGSRLRLSNGGFSNRALSNPSYTDFY